MWQEHPQSMRKSLLRHDEILKECIETAGGYVFKTVGDAFCAAFDTAMDGVHAALHAQLGLKKENWDPQTPIHVRMAIHTGEAVERDQDYFGQAVNRTARLESIGYGGQVLVSLVTAELVRDLLPENVTLKEMGARRLKDLTRPELVYQLMHPDLPFDFPELKSLETHAHNLPIQPTPLIGREEEIAAIEAMLSSPAEPIITLTGPGGMGKTRLALQIGAELIEHFEDGVFFVDLSSLKDPSLMSAAVAQVLKLKESGSSSFAEIVRDYLKSRHILLILDNFEQILASRDRVVELARSCANLKIIITSREAIHVRGEKVFGVPPLTLPEIKEAAPTDIDTMTQFEAVRLFIERATSIRNEFSVTNDNAPSVAEICVRLDGIPLAIELAAARVRFLSPEAILDLLESRLKLLKGGIKDLPERQQTLRATIDWSYNMLDDDCKCFFRYLSVFSGGFSFDAAESICTRTPEDANLFEGIESLVNKSFVFPEDSLGLPRFHLLETMKEYGVEKLKEEGEFEEARDKHAAYYKALVANLCSRLHGKSLKESLDRLDKEYANIRDAIGWFHTQDKTRQVLEVCSLIWRFWQLRGHLTEGRLQIEKALQLGKREKKTLIATALLGAGNLAKEQGEHEKALSYLKRCYLFQKDEKDSLRIATTTNELGWVLYRMDKIGDAKKVFQSGLKAAVTAGDRYLEAMHIIGIANTSWREGKNGNARANLEKAKIIARKIEDPHLEALVTANIGINEREQGHLTTAKDLYESTLKRLKEVDDQATLRGMYNNLGDIHHLLGNYEDSIRYFTLLLELSTSVGDRRFVSRARAGIAEALLAMGNTDGAYDHAVEAYKEVEDFNAGMEIGLSLRLLGDIFLARAKPDEAREYLERSIPYLEQAYFDEELQKARDGLAKAKS